MHGSNNVCDTIHVITLLFRELYVTLIIIRLKLDLHACMHGDMNQARDDQGYQFRILHFVACYNFRLHTLPRLYLGL